MAVSDVKCMLACMLRMHLSNEAVVFWNHSREFKVMIRNDPVDAETVAFDVCIVYGDEDDETVASRQVPKVLEMEYDGYFDEEGTFVVDEYSFKMDQVARHPDMLDEARKKINEIHAFRICRCGSYFIKDGGAMCLFCQLTNENYESRQHFCAICHENSIERHMLRQTCCNQMLHRSCLSTWVITSKDTRCPLCRCSSGNGSGSGGGGSDNEATEAAQPLSPPAANS
jgi:hypothetical protein